MSLNNLNIKQSEEGRRSFDMAMRAPTRYVVKPQREGGGNNIYGEDIVPFLKSIESSSERDAYIMMDRIQPPITTNYMVRPATPVRLVKCISELGIFGYIIGYAFFLKNTLKITNHSQNNIDMDWQSILFYIFLNYRTGMTKAQS